MSQRFTIDGNAELEQHLAASCEIVREGVTSIIHSGQLEGLVLAGGYGRGEGGVLRENDRDLPYNDLEFFVFVRGSTQVNDRRYKEALHRLGERLSPAVGLDVEFKIFSLAKLRRSRPGMFFYDLVMGHRWLIGDDTLLRGCEHHCDASSIPLHEATRLLFNRCSGLLFAKERLSRQEFTAADADFVGRNLAKAQLALGDALLASHGQYHWSCQERHRRLMELSYVPEDIRMHHVQGVSFKLHPQRSQLTHRELAAEHAALSVLTGQLFLDIETRRLDRPFCSAVVYAHSGINKCPEQPAWRNLLIHLRTRGLPCSPLRYPREHLLHGLALMLWGCQPATPESVRAYEALWCRFN